MPASGGDPVNAALCLSLSVNQEANDDIDKRLTASCSRVLTTHIEFEQAPSYQSKVLNSLKNKYILLKTNGDNNSSNNSTNGGLSTASPSSCSDSTNMKLNSDSVLPTPKLTLFPPECVQLGWRGTFPVGAGFINVGNSCYLNASLQALFHVPALVNWLHSDSTHLGKCSLTNGMVHSECIICAMNKTLRASQSKSTNIIKPFLICNKLKMICKHMMHGQQEDAHEFMRYLIESMEKSYLTRFKGNKLDNYSKETTPMNQIFGGYMRTEVKCMVCQSVSTTFQHFQDLLLDIRRAVSVGEALAGYFANERLDEADYRCDRCHKKVNATKRYYVEKAPRVLCVQLKRFSIGGGKMNKHVSVPQRLDLGRYVSAAGASHDAALTYRLVAMVNHVGSSVNCGHYTAVARSSTGQLYHFDDSCVRPVSSPTVPDANAYIIVYEADREPGKATNGDGGAARCGPQMNGNATKVAATEAGTSGVGTRPVTVPGFNGVRPTVPTTTHRNLPSVIPMTNHKVATAIAVAANGKHNGPSPATAFNHKFLPLVVDSPKKVTVAAAIPLPSARDRVAFNFQPRLNGLVPYDDEDSNGSSEREAAGTGVGSPSKANGGGGWRVKDATGAGWAVSEDKSSENSGCEGGGGELEEGELEPEKVENKLKRKREPQEGEFDWVSKTERFTNGHTLTPHGKPTSVNGKLISDSHHGKSNGNIRRDSHANEPSTGGVGKTTGKPEAPCGKTNGNLDAMYGKPAFRDGNGKISNERPDHRAGVNGRVEANGKANGDAKRVCTEDRHAKPRRDDHDGETPCKTNASNGRPQQNGGGCAGTDYPQRWGDSRTDPAQQLKKLSHRGYGTQVASWTGGRSHVDREAGVDWRAEQKRQHDRAYDDDLDRGRTKKVKQHNHRDDYSRYNKFQRYQDDARQWGGGGGHSGKMYYNKTHGHRHKYGGGGKHHRDNWRR